MDVVLPMFVVVKHSSEIISFVESTERPKQSEKADAGNRLGAAAPRGEVSRVGVADVAIFERLATRTWQRGEDRFVQDPGGDSESRL
jgi:hypothetical protein